MDRGFTSTNQTESVRIAQVSATGGVVAPVQIPFADAYITGLKSDDSVLLAFVPSSLRWFCRAPRWLIPLPAGQPRRLGNFQVEIDHMSTILAGGVDMFPDGRIVFALSNRGAAQWKTNKHAAPSSRRNR